MPLVTRRIDDQKEVVAFTAEDHTQPVPSHPDPDPNPPGAVTQKKSMSFGWVGAGDDLFCL